MNVGNATGFNTSYCGSVKKYMMHLEKQANTNFYENMFRMLNATITISYVALQSVPQLTRVTVTEGQASQDAYKWTKVLQNSAKHNSSEHIQAP